MAFNSTTPHLDRTPLMEIDVGGGTVYRWSDQFIILDDDTIYEPRILTFPDIRISLGWLLDSKFRRPSITVILDNADDAITTAHDAHEGFAGAEITLKIGHGTAAADFETRFVGQRRFPGGIRWDHNTFQLEIEWDIAADMRPLPINRFDPTDYPLAAAGVWGRPIPEIYGDYRSTVLGAQKVPAYQIDTTNFGGPGVGGKWKIARTLQSIEAVYRNGVSVAFTASGADVTAGEFFLNVAYNALTDTVEAHVLGQTTATFAGAGAEFSLPRLTYDLLTNSNLIGLAAARMNVTAFAAWEADLPTNALGRRWIGRDTPGAELVAELMSDGNADMYLNPSNEYTPVSRKRQAQAGLTVFREADLAPAPGGDRAYSVEVDPETTYANEVLGEYAATPTDVEGWASFILDTAPNRITAVGTRKRRRFTMNWLYNEAGAGPRVQKELAIYSREVQAVEIRVGAPGLVLEPTDQFTLIYSTFDNSGLGTTFQIRDITYDFQAMEATIHGWNLNPLTSGYWTLDAAPNWATATDAQKAAQGFWTDANGLSDADSKWF